jgi:hypothetical protein
MNLETLRLNLPKLNCVTRHELSGDQKMRVLLTMLLFFSFGFSKAHSTNHSHDQITQIESESPINKMLPEQLIYIFVEVREELGTLMNICKDWTALINHPLHDFWRRIFIADFSEHKCEDLSYKEAYRKALSELRTCSDAQQALRISIKSGYEIQLKNLLLGKKADPDVKYRQNDCTLYEAAALKKYTYDENFNHILMVLLEIDNNVHALYPDGSNSLYFASQEGWLEAVKFLLKHKVEPVRYQENYSPLYIAADRGHHLILESLAREFPELINEIAGNSATPLYIAAQKGHGDCVNVLLSFGALTTKCASLGFTPLYIASQQGYEEIVMAIVSANNTKVDELSKGGVTPLYIAVVKGHLKIIEILLKYNADINILNDQHETPLDAALSTKRRPIIDFLVLHGAVIGEI